METRGKVDIKLLMRLKKSKLVSKVMSQKSLRFFPKNVYDELEKDLIIYALLDVNMIIERLS